MDSHSATAEEGGCRGGVGHLSFFQPKTLHKGSGPYTKDLAPKDDIDHPPRPPNHLGKRRERRKPSSLSRLAGGACVAPSPMIPGCQPPGAGLRGDQRGLSNPSPARGLGGDRRSSSLFTPSPVMEHPVCDWCMNQEPRPLCYAGLCGNPLCLTLACFQPASSAFLVLGENVLLQPLN